jgi:hypothetical protein
MLMVGAMVGLATGSSVGVAIGASVGSAIGTGVGLSVGSLIGFAVGLLMGTAVGLLRNSSWSGYRVSSRRIISHGATSVIVLDLGDSSVSISPSPPPVSTRILSEVMGIGIKSL